MSDYRKMLMEVQKLDFSLTETAMFLDSHPDDEKALKFYERNKALAEEARDAFICEYGPLTATDQRNTAQWEWVKSPWPWECEE